MALLALGIGTQAKAASVPGLEAAYAELSMQVKGAFKPAAVSPAALATPGALENSAPFLWEESGMAWEYVQSNDLQGKALAAQVDLARLLNRQYRTRLVYELAGSMVWVSGIFGPQGKAYTSVLIDGYEPLIYETQPLLWRERRFSIRDNTYRISVWPDLIDKMKGQFLIANVKNRKETIKFTARDMFEAYLETSEKATLNGRTCHIFYFDAINGGKPDAAFKTLAFVFLDNKRNPKKYLVQAQDIPQGSVRIFPMFDGKLVGLEISGGILYVYNES